MKKDTKLGKVRIFCLFKYAQVGKSLQNYAKVFIAFKSNQKVIKSIQEYAKCGMSYESFIMSYES